MFCSSKVGSIIPSDPSTWKKKVFLTFDLDWAHEEVIEDTIDLISQSGVSSTWFVTHKSPILDNLEKLKNAELGIHPNFFHNQNSKSNLHSEDIIRELLDFLPNSKSVRSHSLFQSERLVDDFYNCGLSHISNCFIPHGTGINVQPFSLWNGMIMVPHCWQDNVALKMNLSFPENGDYEDSYQMFNFHPIHVFLNTENESRYESTRSYHQNPQRLIQERFDGFGTRSLLINLLNRLEK